MNIIITGAGKGIGYELVKFFAEEGSHRIIAISRNIEKIYNIQPHTNSEVIPLKFDLTGIIESDNLILEKISEHFSNVDILINNAGYLHNAAFEQISKIEAEKILKVNFLVPSLLIRELLPLMGMKSHTHVVNIGSMGGVQGSSKYPGLAYYSAAKAALAVLTECLAAEHAKSNIYFNCLALGAVQTEMLDVAFPGYKAPLTAEQIAPFIAGFALTGYKYFNGKILPVALSNP